MIEPRANPILARELSLVFSRRGAALRLLLFAGAVAAAVYLVWPREVKLLIYRDRISQLALGVLTGSMRLLILLFGPAYSALSVTRDREQGSLDLICSASMGAPQLFHGKFLASAIYLWMLIAATMPMAAAVYLLGGVSLWSLAVVYLELFLWAPAIAAYGVACSARAPSSPAALAQAYGHILPLGALWVVFPQVHVVWILIPVFALPIILRHKPTLLRFQHPDDPLEEAPSPSPPAPKKAQRPDLLALVFGRRRMEQPMSDWSSPVLTRELRCQGLGGAGWIRSSLGVALGMGIISAVGLIRSPNPTAPWFLLIATVVFLIVPAMSASAMTREFDQGTHDALIVTALRPASILWPKIYVAMRTGAVFALLLAGLGAGALACRKDLSGFGQAPICLAVLGCALLFLSVLGVFISLASRSTAQAVVRAYAAAAVPFAGGPLLCWLLGMLSDFPAQSYAWIAMASPATPLLALARAKWLSEALLQYTPGQLAAIYCTLSVSLSAALFVVMALGFDYFWKKGPLRRT